MSSTYQPLTSDETDWDRRKNRVSHWNRQRKWKRFETWAGFTPETRVLDVGFSDEEYSKTDNFIEKHYPYRSQITALGVEEPVHFGQRYPDVEVVQYDGALFPFADDSFDIVWSNAVIEHVGDIDAQRRFISEVARVGKRAFITTPNRWFPVEVHTRTPLLHYLPKPVFYKYLHRVGHSWAADDYMWLLSKGDLEGLLKPLGVRYEIITNRIAGFGLDFVVQIEG